MAQQGLSISDRFHTYVPRFVTNPELFKKMSKDVENYPVQPSPEAPWTVAIKAESGERLPQIIAHRGFKSKFPENTMLAFKKAISSGAHALETDIHLSRDNVAVLSHDASLKRCFGSDKRVVECDWEDLSSLRTVAPPHEPLPRLVDLLGYLAQPEHGNIWVLLDIKMDDDPSLMMRSISEAIAAAPKSSSVPWSRRIVLGIWAVKYLTPCATYLPDYAISNIGFSTIYARRFMTPKTPNVSFNMFYSSLMMPISGPRFIRDAHRSGRSVFVWTVNDPGMMKWCIKHGLDGVITDDVEKLANTRAVWERGDRKFSISIRTYAWLVWVWLLSSIFAGMVGRRLDRPGGLRSKRAR